MNTFTYRAVGEKVTIVADKVIRGTSEPRTSRGMSGQDAVQYLKEKILWVPGRVSANFSEDWDPTEKEQAPRHVSLETLDEAGIAKFKEMAAAKARELYGIEPGIDQLPKEKWPEFRSYLLRLRGALGG
jgi:hypothetical protein